MAADFIAEFKANMRHFITDIPCQSCTARVDVLPVLAYIDQLDRDGGLTSAVSDKLRSLIKGLQT